MQLRTKALTMQINSDRKFHCAPFAAGYLRRWALPNLATQGELK